MTRRLPQIREYQPVYQKWSRLTRHPQAFPLPHQAAVGPHNRTVWAKGWDPPNWCWETTGGHNQRGEAERTRSPVPRMLSYTSTWPRIWPREGTTTGREKRQDGASGLKDEGGCTDVLLKKKFKQKPKVYFWSQNGKGLDSSKPKMGVGRIRRQRDVKSYLGLGLAN